MFGTVLGSLFLAALASVIVAPLGITAVTGAVFVVAFVSFVALSVYWEYWT